MHADDDRASRAIACHPVRYSPALTGQIPKPDSSHSEHFKLSPAEREELLPSAKERRFDNRVAWAKVYLQRAGCVKGSRRAHFEITDRGRQLLAERPERITIALLERFDDVREFRRVNRIQQGAGWLG